MQHVQMIGVKSVKGTNDDDKGGKGCIRCK